MLRRILLVLVSLLVAAVAFVAGGLYLAKRAILHIDPTLPSVEDVMNVDPDADLPVRLSWINTASQTVPRRGVLEPALDPDPNAPYVLSLAAFVLEWADGRIFLIDLGMDPESAIAFGKPFQSVLGSGPMEPHGTVAEALGDKLARVAGVSFTHEHVDHVTGALELCKRHPASIPLFLGKLWSTESNYTTRPGLRVLDEAKCLSRRELEGGPLLAIPGFPGLAFFAAAGHTPGSQVFVAHVKGAESVKTWILTGDVVNNIDGIRHNIPKPALYSLLVVPENTKRLDEVRRFIGGLEREQGAGVLVTHDQLALEASGIPKF
jgi:glyoxylase-like metal-dependent hydrolase (beta-lactamase superfamily II)